MTFEAFKAKWLEELNESEAMLKAKNGDCNAKLVSKMQEDTLKCILEVLEDYHENVKN